MRIVETAGAGVPAGVPLPPAQTSTVTSWSAPRYIIWRRAAGGWVVDSTHHLRAPAFARLASLQRDRITSYGADARAVDGKLR